MKQKKQNRILAALLAVAMMFQMLPMMAFAAEGDGAGSTEGEVSVNNNERFKEAVQSVPANGEITIHLGAGTYTLYEGDGPNGSLVKSGVKIHLVGEGIDITTLEIGGPLNDPPAGHEEQGSDYSFGGADTVTFEDMTLTTRYQRDYQGFSHINNETSVDRCKINGYTAYWGYDSATFTNTTFNAPGTAEAGGSKGYALWTYCSPIMTFNNCTFNGVGKVINVYTDYSAGTHDITVNFKDCTVHSSEGVVSIFNSKKTALNINDYNMGSYKYILNLSGNNQVTAARDNTTCTQLFGFGGKSASDTGRTEVNIDGVCVWKKDAEKDKGKMQTHAYTDGANEPNLKDTYTDWTENVSHSYYEREVTTTCGYCGYTTKGVETGHKLAYDLNGGAPAEGADYTDKIVAENKTVTLAAAPVREGFYFVGWEDESGNRYDAAADITPMTNTKLTAQWDDVPPVVPDTPDGGGKEVATVIVAAGAAVLGYYVGTGLLMDCYRLPYWPKNRSELALMLWEDADRPMPESALLYPDVGQKEEDMDLQHAARWAMENELLPDLNWDDSRTEEEMKFYPNYSVSRVRALHAWRKAQQLKQDA